MRACMPACVLGEMPTMYAVRCADRVSSLRCTLITCNGTETSVLYMYNKTRCYARLRHLLSLCLLSVVRW